MMPIALRIGDVWTPTRGKQAQRHVRTITAQWLVPEGERIAYWDEEDGQEYQCWGPTFRDWVKVLRCELSIDIEVAGLVECVNHGR